MMNLECCSRAYLDPEAFPLRASFSEASPKSIEGGLYGIFLRETRRSSGCYFKTYFLAFSTSDKIYFLIGGRSKISLIILA